MTRRGGLNWPFLRRKSSSSYSINKDSSKGDHTTSRHSTSSLSSHHLNHDNSIDSGILDFFCNSTSAKFKSTDTNSTSMTNLNYGQVSNNVHSRSSKKSTCKLFKTPLHQLCSDGKLPAPIMVCILFERKNKS